MSLYRMLHDQEEQGGQVRGLALGVVTNNRDEQGMGRVKVRYPWREGSQDSFWARPAVLMGGGGRGTYFVPEVGDEVILGFDQGDIRFPYVVGALWNGKDQAPETNSDGKNNIRKIRSRSGHELVFNDDSEGRKEKVEITTKAGHKVVLDDTSGSEKIEIKDKTGSNLVVIDSVKNSVTIESAASLKIKSQKIDIEAGAAMTLKAGATLTIQGALVKIN